jgi:hypothetical protein
MRICELILRNEKRAEGRICSDGLFRLSALSGPAHTCSNNEDGLQGVRVHEWSNSNIRILGAETRLRMLESEDHSQIIVTSGALDLPFA